MGQCLCVHLDRAAGLHQAAPHDWTELEQDCESHSCVRFVPHASINEFPKYLSILVSQGPVASASGGTPRGGAPAPPPPGPPPPPMDLGKSSGGDSGATNHNALFASINKGADITKGIKWIPNLM